MLLAAAPYRASGLVLWRKAVARGGRNSRSSRRLVAALGLGMLRRGSSHTGTRMHMNGFCGQRFTAFRADHYGIEHLLAALVFVQQRTSARVDHVDVSPVHDRHDDRIEVEA